MDSPESCTVKTEPFDVIFLSYDEPNCEENWRKVQKLFRRAQRVHGVEGLSRAHIECSRRARTENYFLIDGDAEVLENADLDHTSFPDLIHNVYLWRSLNPVNGLVSGCGGIKLAHRSAFLSGFKGTDLTTGIDRTFVRVPILASISRFNASPLTGCVSRVREDRRPNAQGL